MNTFNPKILLRNIRLLDGINRISQRQTTDEIPLNIVKNEQLKSLKGMAFNYSTVLSFK